MKKTNLGGASPPPPEEEKLSSTLTADVALLASLDAKYADLPLLIKRPRAQQLFDRSLKWFQRREAKGELHPIKKDQGVVFYRRDEVLRAVGLIK
jgi:hypothetical protein